MHVHLVGQNISNSRHEKFRLWRDDGTDKKKELFEPGSIVKLRD